MSVSELDGKHSESDCDISIEKNTLEYFVDNHEKNNASRDITEYLIEHIIDDLDIPSLQFDTTMELIDYIENLASLEETEITLNKDTEIENILVPKGTLISFCTKPKLPDNTLFDLDFSKFFEENFD